MMHDAMKPQDGTTPQEEATTTNDPIANDGTTNEDNKLNESVDQTSLSNPVMDGNQEPTATETTSGISIEMPDTESTEPVPVATEATASASTPVTAAEDTKAQEAKAEDQPANAADQEPSQEAEASEPVLAVEEPAGEATVSNEAPVDVITSEYLSSLEIPFREQLSINDEGELILDNPAMKTPKNYGVVAIAGLSEIMRALNNNYEALLKEHTQLNDMWNGLKEKLRTRSNVAAFNKSLEEKPALGDFSEMIASIEEKKNVINEIYEANAAERKKIIDEAASLSDSTDWKKTSERYNELLEMWKNGPEVKKSVHDDLWEQYRKAKDAFHQRRQAHYEELEKDHMVNLDKKIELCEQAEALAHSQEWKKTTEKMNALMEEWKSIGHLPSGHKNEEMWERFSTARKTFFDNKKEHGSRIKVEQEANLEIKTKLLERVEEICHSKDWRAVSQEMDDLQKQWEAAGRVPIEHSDLLWNRWRAARDTFYNAKRAHTDAFVSNLEENYERKKVITERAEKISNSIDFKNTTDELMSMMEEWKTIGPVPKSYGDDLWNRFNKARRDFFKRKDEDREQRKKTYEKRMYAKMNQTEQFLYTLNGELKEDQAKLAEFKEAIANHTGEGKKELELKANLERLVQELEESIPRKQEKIKEVEGQLAAINKKSDNSEQQ